MKTFCLFFLLTVFFASCKKEDPAPTQLLKNTSLEKYAGSAQPWLNAGYGRGFLADWSAEDYVSPSHSLKIVRTPVSDPLNTEFWYWYQTVWEDIPVGKELTLSVKIKGVDLYFDGLSIAIRGDNDTSEVQFVTTQGIETISGNFDWTTYSVDFPPVQSDVVTLWVFLIMLPNTVGIAYFDDIELRVKED